MKKYTPIDCNYYDELEALATLRRHIRIEYKDLDGMPQQVESTIIDFFIDNKVEYLRLQNGLDIRLDFLLSVNGLKPPASGDEKACQIPKK